MSLYKNYSLLRFVLFSIILLPSFRVFPGFPSIRFDDIILLSWPFIFLMQNKLHIPRQSILRAGLMLAFVFLLPFSILNGTVNGYESSFGDFNQIVRIFKYISMYVISSVVLFYIDDFRMVRIIKFTIWCGIILLIISFFQYFNLFNLNKYYVQIIAPTQYETLLDDYPNPRPVGMIGNPNELGFMFVILSIISLWCVFYFRARWYIFAFFLFFFGVLMTLSRGSMVALGSGLVVFFLIHSFHGGILSRIKASLFIVILVSFLLSVAMIPQIYEAYTWRFMNIFDMKNDISFMTRVDNWSENINIIKEHPVIGVGPLSRFDFEYAADNEWLLIWRRYGVIGVIITILFFLSTAYRRMTVPVRAMYAALVCSSFVYMVPSAVFHSLALFPILLFLLAFVDVRGNFLRGDRRHIRDKA
ncbi:O-antigen ligase family protein [Aquamicrobium sp.]|uniref:O-antigen ligase family protein n=1 Tax=Aquamicrobium sp. TaxID=1872579 RepID=UPI00259031A6|nr:O-antigen ligase family protein [Aquamicrobium sp.]MCK9549670.1 O-antigen ligase family protein [Aquamicrobium sp.]